MKPLGHLLLGLRSWKSAAISGLDGRVDGRWVDDREKGFALGAHFLCVPRVTEGEKC